MYCRNCNAKLNENIEVCPYCREKTGYVKDGVASKAGTIPIWFWIICFILPPVGIVFFFIYRNKATLTLLTEEEFESIGGDIETLTKLNNAYGVDISTLSYQEYAELFDKTRKDATDKKNSFKEAFAYGLVAYLLVIAVIFIVWATLQGYNPNANPDLII